MVDRMPCWVSVLFSTMRNAKSAIVGAKALQTNPDVAAKRKKNPQTQSRSHASRPWLPRPGVLGYLGLHVTCADK